MRNPCRHGRHRGAVRARVALAAALGLLAPWGASAAHSHAAPDPGDSPPWPHPSTLNLRVMPLGDSLTRGHADPEWNGYRRDLWVRLRTSTGEGIDFTGSQRDGTMGDNNHEGHPGYRTDHLAARVPVWVARYRPEVVLLLAGTNDVALRHDLPNAPARLSRLVDRTRAARPGVWLFVATIPRFRDRRTDPLVDEFNRGVLAVVNSKRSPRVRLVPLHIVGATPGDLADHVHPSRCGYAKLAYVLEYYLHRSPLNPGTWLTPARNPWYTTGPCR